MIARAYGTPYWTSRGVAMGRLGRPGLGFDWEIFQNVTQTGLDFTKDVLKLRPPAGTVIYQTPQGTYSAGPGIPSAQILPPGLFQGFGGSQVLTWLIFGGVAIALIAVVSKR